MARFGRVEKTHSACDECRSRKLKCSGDTPMCLRCERERIECVYSPQKPMGRPKKRRREDENKGDGPSYVPTIDQIRHDNEVDDNSAGTDQVDIGLTSPTTLYDIGHASSSIENQLTTPVQHDFDFASSFINPVIPDSDFSLTSPINPSIWDLQPSTANSSSSIPDPPLPESPCTCLSLTYLTLSTLQSLPTFSFPQIIPSLRTAMTTLSTLINCPICPLDSFSAIQNIQSIVSLFKALISRFSKVLLEVDAEAARLTQNNEKKPFRIGDNSAALAHLHTGTPDCPMGFNIELEAREWRKIVKTALKTEVCGGGSNARPLVQLLSETVERQRRWHAEPGLWTEEMGHLRRGENYVREGSCEALGAEHIRRAIENLVWD